MDPVLTPMIIGAVTKAAGRTTAGLGSVASGLIAARALKMTPEEERELALLQAAEAAGQEALTAEQEALIRQRFLAEQGAQAREQQAGQLQAVAARAAAPATAGREIFLAEQAAQQGALARTQQRNLALTQAEDAAAADRQARISFLQQRQEAYELAKAGAEATLVAAPLDAAAEGLGTYGSTWGEMAVAGTLPPEEPPPETDWVNQTTTGL